MATTTITNVVGSGIPPVLRRLPYRSLHRGKTEEDSEFRLLCLGPGPKGSPLQLILEHVSFKAASDAYAALSYVWGQQDHSREIVSVQYGDRVYRISIGENLASALHNLRTPDQPITLWTDAICIDQGTEPDSLKERSWQVQMMGSIYRNCAFTLVWLGDGNDEIDRVFTSMERIAEEFEKVLPSNAKCWIEGIELILTLVWTTRAGLADGSSLAALQFSPNLPWSLTPGPGASFYDGIFSAITNTSPDELDDVNPDILLGIQDICSREYWGRVWILQEYYLAPEVVFCCGDGRISDIEFCRGIQACSAMLTFLKAVTDLSGISFCLDGQTEIHPETKHVLTMKHRVRNQILHNGTFDHMQMANYAGRKSIPRGATDPRDRVYAMLGLIENKDRLGVIPNYLLKTEVVYSDLSERLLLGQANLHLLTRVRPMDNKLSLPSWCIDWTAFEPDTVYRTASLPKSTISLGTSFFDIELSSSPHSPRGASRAMFTKARFLGRISDRHATFAEMEASIYAYHGCTGTLHADACVYLMEIYANLIARDRPEHDVFYDMVRMCLPEYFCRHLAGTDSDPIQSPFVGTTCESVIKSCALIAQMTEGKFLSLLAENGYQQRLVETDKGHYGNAVLEVECGDIVAQIGPFEYQVVLREVEEDFYKIVGGAHFPQTVDRTGREVTERDFPDQIYIV